jgi:hypothetical protein
MESTEAKTNSMAFMGSQLMMSAEPTEDDWLNSKSKPYITEAKVIKDGRKIATCKKNRLKSKSLRKTLAKLLAKKATTGKPIKKTRMFIFGDFANPVGTEPFALLALTEERAKILAICNMTLKFNVIFLIFRELQQSL